jgi:hypothetical protein
MDWKVAIEINKQALARIIATLVALLGAQGGAVRLPIPVYQALWRILYPAESALRRLIVMAARGLVVPPQSMRPMPRGLVIARKAGGRMSFQLFDTRKHFGDPDDDSKTQKSGPRIRVIYPASPRELFLARFATPRDGRCSAAETSRLSQRISVLAEALAQLPRQAKRMARWLKRRAEMESPLFRFPMRPGRPPGHQRRPREDIDHLLKECHALAWMSLEADTS